MCLWIQSILKQLEPMYATKLDLTILKIRTNCLRTKDFVSAWAFKPKSQLVLTTVKAFAWVFIMYTCMYICMYECTLVCFWSRKKVAVQFKIWATFSNVKFCFNFGKIWVRAKVWALFSQTPPITLSGTKASDGMSYAYVFICTYVLTYVCSYVCLCVCTYVPMYICIFICNIFSSVHMYVHMYECTFASFLIPKESQRTASPPRSHSQPRLVLPPTRNPMPTTVSFVKLA
jgi:hypothetical protein